MSVVVQLYNFREGNNVLAEFRGSAGDVVLVTAFSTPTQSFALRDTPLGYARSVPLNTLKDTPFNENVSSFQMHPLTTLLCDSNGYAHWIIAASGISAGAELRVEATALRVTG